MKELWNTFLSALMFYTRIPVPRKFVYEASRMPKANAFLPLLGLLVGGAGGLVYLGAQMVLPVSVSVLLCMLTTVLLTGAFHEDALADFCDGFGGGSNQEAILRIMKDSHIGTYGTVGLILSLLLRFFMLSALPVAWILPVIAVGNAYSRLNPVLMMRFSTYVRENAANKAGDAAKATNQTTVATAFLTATASLILLPFPVALITLPVQFLTLFLFRTYVHKKLGGYTGDVLGMLQQLSELVFYLTFLVVHFFA